MNSPLWQAYQQQVQADEAVNIDELVTDFDRPIEALNRVVPVEHVDDRWFYSAVDDARTRDLAERIARRYEVLRGAKKTTDAALHDALLIRWVQKEKTRTGDGVWVVTIDGTLPGAMPEQSQERPIAITLEAIFQWISPLSPLCGDDREMHEAFAQMIKHRLLPQEQIFELEDFEMFHELHIAAKELPAEDVEKCIKYIKRTGPKLDLSNPVDREKLSYALAKYFADPGTRYKQEFERFEEERRDFDELTRKLQSRIKESEQEKAALAQQFNDTQERQRQAKLRTAARSWMIAAFAVILVLEGAVVYCANRWGSGANFLQKIIACWPVFAALPPVVLVCAGVIMGKKRLGALSPVFLRLLGQQH